MTLHDRYAYPLWWDLRIACGEWALPLRIKVRPRLTDGSGRREYVANVELSLLCLHWNVHYAWGKKRYREMTKILSLSEVMQRDRRDLLTRGWAEPDNDP
jgi:hypothetical protein